MSRVDVRLRELIVHVSSRGKVCELVPDPRPDSRDGPLDRRQQDDEVQPRQPGRGQERGLGTTGRRPPS